MRNSAFTAILLGGFVAGTIDIGAAALINMTSPVVIMQAIAGGLLGKAAFDGGASAAIFGLVLQWLMSLLIAAVYVAAACWLLVLKRQWIFGGLAYGLGVFFVMNYVVLPLSAWHRWPHMTPNKFAENMAAMLLFGLIVALFARSSAN